MRRSLSANSIAMPAGYPANLSPRQVGTGLGSARRRSPHRGGTMHRPVRLIAAAVAVPLFLPSLASAAVHQVGPGDSIQAAVDAASPGDTIVVRGVHDENTAVTT